LNSSCKETAGLKLTNAIIAQQLSK
jgi:hypothetical protein